MEEARRIHDELNGQHAHAEGVLRVSMPVDFAYEFLAPILPAFSARYPDIALEIDVTPRKMDLIGEPFDLVVRAGQLADSGHIATLLMHVPCYLYASPAYLKRNGTPAALDELVDRDCLRFQGVNRWMLYEDSGDPASGVRAGRQGRLRRQTGRKTAPPQEADGRVEVVAASMHSANSIGFLQRLAVQGMGVALLPEIAARPDVRAGRLVRILLDWQGSPAPVHALTATRLLPARARAFIDFLKACAQEQHGSDPLASF